MMNDSDSPLAILPINEMSQVLDVQNRFELACQASCDATPAIESYFAEIAGKGQKLEQVMLHHLIMLDLQYRSERHESLEIQSYLERFPSHAYVVQSCFRAFEQLTRSLDIIGPLAEGGLGAVDVAWDRSLNRKVAFKRLKTDFADDREKQARFRREALITARLRHPGIVAIYSLNDKFDGQVSYVMPLIEGEPLDEVIQRFHKSIKSRDSSQSYAKGLRELLKHFVDACQAIAYAHSLGCIHRDLKPQNIMVGPFGETVVVDWGLAKFLAEDDQSNDSVETSFKLAGIDGNPFLVTRTGDILGTPMYMSPEQAEGKGISGTSSDIYSLGVTLFYLLTGALPFDETDSKSLLSKIIAGQFPKLREVQPEAPAALEAICLKCLATLPQDRYSSVKDLIRDIDNWLANESVAAYSEPWHSRLARLTRLHPTWTGIGAVSLLLSLLGLSLLVSLTTWKNQQLREAVAVASSESERADQMFQFFVNELSAASPEKVGNDRIADISQLMLHMLKSSERFRESSPVTYAKLLWNISSICRDRSEFSSAQQGFETLLQFLNSTSSDQPVVQKMLVPVKLKLADCYIAQSNLRSKVDSLLADIEFDRADEGNRILYAGVMGWSKYYQKRYHEAQAFIDLFDRGVSSTLDRLQATLWSASNREEEACELLNELIRNLPESKSKEAILLYNTLADIHRRQNQFELAEACSLKSIELADRFYSGHDQARLMPRGQLMDIYYGNGRFADALLMSQQIFGIINSSPENASVRQMLPVLKLRTGIFRLGSPDLTSDEAERILLELNTVKLRQSQDVYESLAAKYLLACFLKRDDVGREVIQDTTLFLKGIPEIADNLPHTGIGPNPALQVSLVVNQRLEKAAGVNGLSVQFQNFLSVVFPALIQE